VFARRFVAMSLARRPPALYVDGRGAGAVYFLGSYLPTFAADLIVYLVSGMASVAKPAKAPVAAAAAKGADAAKGGPPAKGAAAAKAK
jgi:hypothetical protein